MASDSVKKLPSSQGGTIEHFRSYWQKFAEKSFNSQPTGTQADG